MTLDEAFDDVPGDELDEIIARDDLQGAYRSRPPPGDPADETYVALRDMSADDIAYNVDRMRKAAVALDRHAYVLLAYHAARSASKKEAAAHALTAPA